MKNDENEEDILIRERRKKRLEILAKYKQKEENIEKPLKEIPTKPIDEEIAKSPKKTCQKDEDFGDMFGDDFKPLDLEPKKARNTCLLNETDDHEGYYNFRVGEVINQYTIKKQLGKGIFSNVLLASKDESTVALKLTRSNDLM
jgi:hypothetical protein